MPSLCPSAAPPGWLVRCNALTPLQRACIGLIYVAGAMNTSFLNILLIGAVVWLIGLTVAVVIGGFAFARGYLRVFRRAAQLELELVHVKEMAKAELDSYKAQNDLSMSALRREVLNTRDRWTVDAYRLMDAELYIQTLETTCHSNNIALPPKPRRAGLDRPITSPRSDDQHNGLDPIDELLSSAVGSYS